MYMLKYLLYLSFAFLCIKANAQLTKVIYEPPVADKVLGISNALLWNGKITMTVGSTVLSQPGNYPDVTLWAGKGYLLNEDGLVSGGQFHTGQLDLNMDIKITPTNKLALLYQFPTGNLFAFDIPYKIWNGTAYESTENVMQNANTGSRPRLQYAPDNKPRATSFMSAGYALLYHEKAAIVWQNYQMTNFGTIFVAPASVMNGNVLHLIAKIETGASQRQIILFNLNTTTFDLTGETIATNADQVCDVTINNNKLYALFVGNGGALTLSQRPLTATTWTSEIVNTDAEPIGERGDLFFDNANVPYVAYQTNTAVKVFKKNGATWQNTFTQTQGFVYDPQHATWGRGVSLLQKGADMLLAYADNRRVYLTNLNILPTGLAANVLSANSIALSWNSASLATFYKIFRDGVEIGTANTTNFTDSNLTPSTNYCYTFQACNAYGCTAISTPQVCATTLPPLSLTALKITNAVFSLGNFTGVQSCAKIISLKIKNLTNTTLTYTLKIMVDTGVLFEQINVVFAPNEEKTIDDTWIGDGTAGSAGITFGGNFTSSPSTKSFAVYACRSNVCPDVFAILPIASNLLPTNTGTNNPQNFTVVAASLTVNNTALTIPSEAKSYTFNTTSNVNFTIFSNATWLSVSAPTGQGTQSVGFSIQENNTNADRQASITVAGCSTTQTITITQKKQTLPNNVVLPTLFTPNGDGKNDVFLVRGSSIKSIQLKILNPKGNIVWQTQDITEATEKGWKAENMPDGIYLCNVLVTFQDGTAQLLNKTLHLSRI